MKKINYFLTIIVLMFMMTSCQKEKVDTESTTNVAFFSEITFSNLSLIENSTGDVINVESYCNYYEINTNSTYFLVTQEDTIGTIKVSENGEFSLKGYPFHQLSLGGCDNMVSVKILY